jgi:parallel beta-helix repeat protein
VLIDGVVVKGASDAGIYVGQSERIIVRNSIASHNVAGIEIENSRHADVFGNIATHNTGGILVFDLPNLPRMGGGDMRVPQPRRRQRPAQFRAQGQYRRQRAQGHRRADHGQ